jgi:hypothetical protein
VEEGHLGKGIGESVQRQAEGHFKPRPRVQLTPEAATGRPAKKATISTGYSAVPEWLLEEP